MSSPCSTWFPLNSCWQHLRFYGEVGIAVKPIDSKISLLSFKCPAFIAGLFLHGQRAAPPSLVSSAERPSSSWQYGLVGRVSRFSVCSTVSLSLPFPFPFLSFSFPFPGMLPWRAGAPPRGGRRQRRAQLPLRGQSRDLASQLPTQPLDAAHNNLVFAFWLRSS